MGGSLFPSDVGMSHVRGIVKIVKDNGGHISISKLAEESEEDVDDLLPLLEACKLLDFITISRSEVRLKPNSLKLISGQTRKVMRDGVSKIEPFKTVIKVLSNGSKTTPELFAYLKSNGVFPEEGDHSVETLLKLLLAWGVRTKLLSYDEEKDTWLLV